MTNVFHGHAPGFGVLRVRFWHAGNFGQAYNLRIAAAMINENAVFGLHGSDSLESLRIAYAIPHGLAVSLKVVNGVNAGFRFRQEVRHASL